MNEKRYEELINAVNTEPITKNSIMCLKEDFVDGGFGMWGWSENWETIQEHFMYVFIPFTVLEYNKRKKERVFRDELVAEIIDLMYWFSFKETKKEFKFYIKWIDVKRSSTYNEFVKTSKELCEFLSDNGYKVNFEIYENPKKALKKALELDQYLPEGEVGFGEFLRMNIEEDK